VLIMIVMMSMGVLFLDWGSSILDRFVWFIGLWFCIVIVCCMFMVSDGIILMGSGGLKLCVF